MPDDDDHAADAAFWMALAREMENDTAPAMQFVGLETPDHVFHDAQIDPDGPIGPVPGAPWGEDFMW